MNVTDDEQLYLLAKQPSSTISTFQGYEINGNTFYTFAQDKKSTNQNSGVRFDAEDGNGNKVTYYGYIEEIWELDYGPNFKVPLFRCKWFNLKDGVQVDPQYGMTTVDFKNLGYDTEPFVLASEVAQGMCTKGIFEKFRHGRFPNPFRNIVRGDGVFHGLAGKFSEAELPKMPYGVCTKGIFDKFRHGRFPNPFPNIVRGDGVFHGLAGKFSEAELPKMP
ncbi:hypothetical protein QYE76_046408 [Lolium multiflorum]|uniref:DUF4216 domain-containing protein n=1 Tax=Lolium multiflorum TaxID=4521 RepID=A0AAD8WYL6_LOLMU|nr:hypothetical protein QYE76_046408 [Lolium multiflorum]